MGTFMNIHIFLKIQQNTYEHDIYIGTCIYINVYEPIYIYIYIYT